MQVPEFVVNSVISFVVRRIHAFGDSIDWELVKMHAIERVNKILPTFLEEPIDIIVAGLIDLAQTVLTSDGFLTKVAELLSAKNFAGLLEAFKDLMWDFVRDQLKVRTISLGTVESKEHVLFHHFKNTVVAV